MVTFYEAQDQITKSGNGDKLWEFLNTASPNDIAAPFLKDLWPSFNGIVAQTPIAHRALTPKVLKEVNQETLNRTLEIAVRAAAHEGYPREGYELLDRLVKAGARTKPAEKTNITEITTVQKLLNAASDVVTAPITAFKATFMPKSYVDSLVAADANVYGSRISRMEASSQAPCKWPEPAPTSVSAPAVGRAVSPRPTPAQVHSEAPAGKGNSAIIDQSASHNQGLKR